MHTFLFHSCGQISRGYICRPCSFCQLLFANVRGIAVVQSKSYEVLTHKYAYQQDAKVKLTLLLIGDNHIDFIDTFVVTVEASVPIISCSVISIIRVIKEALVVSSVNQLV